MTRSYDTPDGIFEDYDEVPHVKETSGDDNSEGSGGGFHGLQIPNLDGLPDSDLEAVAAELRKVQDYIAMVVVGRQHRLAGKINGATFAEQCAKSIYKTFAPELKW